MAKKPKGNKLSVLTPVGEYAMGEARRGKRRRLGESLGNGPGGKQDTHFMILLLPNKLGRFENKYLVCVMSFFVSMHVD